ncbi:hypothetical protein FB451DRAFT_511322 [Mycena latifolia]|nr:hypothetical protein FB451DRAFT_511322 [Mycena latifolia]
MNATQPSVNPDNDHIFRQRMSLVWRTVRNCQPESSSWVVSVIVADIVENGKMWIFLDGDEDYLSPSPDFPVELANCRVTTPEAHVDTSLQDRALQTTPEMTIAMIIWLVITSPILACWQEEQSDWHKWDVQGRAITIWADTFSLVMRSKKRPSDVIATDDRALAAFESAMKREGHEHDYWRTPDVGTWVTMRAAFYPELKGSQLACHHFNDEDGCPLCDARLQHKIQFQAGHMPPLHLVALFEYTFDPHFEDFEEMMAFVVARQPVLFSPQMVQPVQDFLGQHCAEKDRRTYCLHYQLVKHDPLVTGQRKYDSYPSWKHVEDAIDSLRRLVPRRKYRYFPVVEPTLWFDMIYVLGRQYRYQDETNSHWRQASLHAANHIQNRNVFETQLPSLNLHLLPEHVQRAVKGFCEATGRDDDRHSCCSFEDWGELDNAIRGRYAAAYAVLQSTDVIPLFNSDDDDCDACQYVRQLYRFIDALSAGQVLLKSNTLAKVLDSIKQLTIIPEDSIWNWNDDLSDRTVAKDDSADSLTPGVSEDSDDEEWGAFLDRLFESTLKRHTMTRRLPPVQ